MGVWIETTSAAKFAGSKVSLLMWECGLKHLVTDGVVKVLTVTPYVGVWIETGDPFAICTMLASLLMWECGLKQSLATY